MIRVCLFMLVGGFAAQHNRVPVSSEFCVLLMVAAAVCFFVPRSRSFGCILFGFGLFIQSANAVVESRLDPRNVGNSLLTAIRVSDFVKQDGQSVSFIAEPIADARLPARTRIHWLNPAQIPAVGELWQLELRLRRPRGSSNPGVFDYETWMFRNNLHASAYVVENRRNRRLAESSLSSLAAYKANFVQRALNVSAGVESAAVLSAIGVGERHLLTRSQWDRYARTGTSHLMAISGLHVGLAASVTFLFLMALLGVLRTPGNNLVQALVGGVVMAASYAWISGFAVPARRSMCMLLFAALAIVLRRRLHALRILALSAVVVFVTDPIATLSPGFHLSFAAVLVLLWQTQGRLPERREKRRATGVVRRLGDLIRMQGALLFGLVPLTVFFFQRIALLAPIANLLLVPLFAVAIVPLALLAMLLLPVSEVASALSMRLAGSSIEFSEAVVGVFAALPLADFATVSFRGPTMFVLPLTALWVILPRRWPGRWTALIALIAVFLQRPATPEPHCFAAYFLDVGQGLATVVQTSRHTMIFDTGVAYRNGSSAAQQVLLPFLKYQGISDIDWLVVSHADLDHSGGVATLHANLRIGQTIAGQTLPGIGVATVPCTAGMAWRADGVEFRVLHPVRGDTRNGNNVSCVVEVSVGDYRLLLTGDIEAVAEGEILARTAIRPAEIVAVPHHGSTSSSTAEFVRSIDASMAIVSAGYKNRWDFPDPAVVARWRESGAEVLNTATSGAISVRFCEKGGLLSVREHRGQQHRFWRDRALE